MWTDLNLESDFRFGDGYDVCVCGSGPAGITIARKLKESGARVLLLEAGGEEWTEESHEFYQGESVGPIEYYGVESGRLRFFGGTSNHWAGSCTRFERVDFERKHPWKATGWPISFDDIYQYEDEARRIVDIDEQSFERPDEPAWKSERFETARYAKSPPTRFGEKYRAELEDAKNVDVVLNANVVDLRLNADKRAVAEVVVADYKGQEYTVAPKFVVIAFGALENARFLLNAHSDFDAGLGNQHDLVGRYFMEHFDVTLGRFVSLGSPFWQARGGFGLNPTAAMMRDKAIGNCFVSLTPGANPKFYGRLAPFRRLMRKITCSSDILLERARRENTVLCEGDGVVTTIMEQSPDPSCRVMLDPDAQDRFGRARLMLDWRINDIDRRTIRTLAEEVGKALVTQRAGRLRINRDILETGLPDLGMHNHHMGTTRMAGSPRHGVVDGDCRVHGIDNLYIGGSSVYPVGGGCNPTLTIVCLSLRLGDHLSRRLSKV